MEHSKLTTQGFTLVELAIVITIIGILVGGVLKGQQLITNARLANTITQANTYETALEIFRGTYGDLPGDMADADTRLPDCTSACIADGTTPLDDRIIGLKDGASTAQADKGLEPVLFWLHLKKAGLITGLTDSAIGSGPVAWEYTHPAAKISGGWHVKNGDGSTDAIWASGNQPKGIIIYIQETVDADLDATGNAAALTPLQAAQIDRKMDDGTARKGYVIAAGSDAACRDGGPDGDSYDESVNEEKRCTIAYRLGRG